MTDQEKIKILTTALKNILQGAEPAGRWISNEDGCAIDGADTEEDGPGEGYYDSEDPPLGYNNEGWLENGWTKPDEFLMPATWEPYTQQEQTD